MELEKIFEELIKTNTNIVVCVKSKETKIEILKKLCSYLPEDVRVATIGKEIPFKTQIGEKRIDLKLEENEDVAAAIKNSLYFCPNWMILEKLKYIPEILSCGINCIITLSMDDVLHTFDYFEERFQDKTLEYLKESINVGIQVDTKEDMIDKIVRYSKETTPQLIYEKK